MSITSALEEGLYWRKQRLPATDRIASFLVGCISKEYLPKSLYVSLDLFSDLVGAASKLMSGVIDQERLPGFLEISVGTEQILIYLDPKLEVGTIITGE